MTAAAQEFGESPQAPSPESALAQALEHAAHLLPDQAPLEFFVHHNTLHSFEHMQFEEAVETAARRLGAEPWLAEDSYRKALAEGRILPEDVEAVLDRSDSAQVLDTELGPAFSRRELRRAALLLGYREASPATLSWLLKADGMGSRLRRDIPAEARRRTLGLTRGRLDRLAGQGDLAALKEVLATSGRHRTGLGTLVDDLGVEPELDDIRAELQEDPEPLVVRALWVACLDLVASASTSRAPAATTSLPRELLLSLTGLDIRQLVHPRVVLYVSAYLDQGVASWPMPERELGLFAAVSRLLRQRPPVVDACWRGLDEELEALGTEDGSEAALALLEDLGVAPEHFQGFVTDLLLTMPGWAGMVHRLERRPDQALRRGCPSRLVDFLALLLLLERRATRHVAETELCYRGPLGGLAEAVQAARGEAEREDPSPRAFRLFQAAQMAGLTATELRHLPSEKARALIDEVEGFDGWTRRRLLQRAYQRRFEIEVLDLVAHAYPRAPRDRPPEPPPVQVFFCIDDREESIRRHLEEVRPDLETFGAAGFYAIPVAYRGHGQAHAFPLCPVSITPENRVEERPVAGPQATPPVIVRLLRSLQLEAGSILEGWLATAVFGLALFVPLVLRIVAPRLAARLRRRLNVMALGGGPRHLTARREDGHTDDHGQALGFALELRVEAVARVLEDAGLVRGFAPLVVVLGHGSTTRNNPHEAAHCCGACSGKDGGPNARLFADFANEPAVREALIERGLEIPAATWFVGGVHDTASDRVELFDLEQVPESHATLLAETRAALDEARARDAHERIRRFGTAPHRVDPQAALRYVEGRSESLNEPRPEYGHATNAICLVGRRAWSRGLFLDRRAFLTSYDPATDASGVVLERLIASVVPVGAGINLEYFFSCVDNRRYGAGTKLPHNIAGLLGVVNGTTGDLRTGLPLEMVDIHEPVRLLNIVEATPGQLEGIARRHEEVGRLVGNGWIRLAALHPETGELWIFEDGQFVRYTPTPGEPPKAPSSMAWYRGSPAHLPMAVLEAGPSTREVARG